MVAARTRESIKGWAHRDRRAQREATRDKFKLRRSDPPPPTPQPEPASFKPAAPPPQAAIHRPPVRHVPATYIPPAAEQQTGFSIEDLRDDTISVVRNSHLSFEDIHAAGGPCPSTLTKLLERTTKKPHLQTLRGALRPCGFDLYIAPKRDAKKN